MINRLILILAICFPLIPQLQADNYGLLFNSHSAPAAQRTSLVLNNGRPFRFDNEFSLNFHLRLRNEPAFGTIFCIQTNDGQTLYAILSNDGTTNQPALILNKQIYPLDYLIGTPSIETDMTCRLLKKENRITLEFAGKALSIPARLEQTDRLKITFGKHPQQQEHIDVAPMNLRDISIRTDGRMLYQWELKQHNDSVCYDLLQNAPATAYNPHWIMNDHVEWKLIYACQSANKIQIAFNPTDNLFYIAQEDTIATYHPNKNKTDYIQPVHGYRAMPYSNYIKYIPQRQTLLSYNLADKLVSAFDFTAQKWNLETAPPNEPSYSNHSWAANDTVAYTFGGYGFYHYNNALFRIRLDNFQIEELDYQSCITPRCAAASALVGSKLYIFGGFGNDKGKQELPRQYYYDLYAIDLEKKTSEKLWSAATPENSFMMASTMYFNPQDSSFYAASTEYGGILMKISLNKPHWEYISQPVFKHLIFKDFTFDLYQATQYNKMYLAINKRMNDLTHEVEIYSIDCPLFDNNQTNQKLPSSKDKMPFLLSLSALSALAVLLFILYTKYNRKRQSPLAVTQPEEEKPNDSYIQPIPPVEPEKTEKGFIPKRSSIHLLGRFSVIDKEGNDITARFTPRAQSLLVLLLLYSEKEEKGILMKKVDDLIWDDKEEGAARNNRNVYMRKLRILLADVGNINIANDKLYYRIQLGEEVFLDYHEAVSRINSADRREESGPAIEETLELLLQGPLLPDNDYEWLDNFKSDYSNLALTFLNDRLNKEMNRKNDELALKIAETIFSHDMLNEEALSAQCILLTQKKMAGIAKNVYDKFCKEYQRCMNESYPRTFNEVCNG